MGSYQLLLQRTQSETKKTNSRNIVRRVGTRIAVHHSNKPRSIHVRIWWWLLATWVFCASFQSNMNCGMGKNCELCSGGWHSHLRVIVSSFQRGWWFLKGSLDLLAQEIGATSGVVVVHSLLVLWLYQQLGSFCLESKVTCFTGSSCLDDQLPSLIASCMCAFDMKRKRGVSRRRRYYFCAYVLFWIATKVESFKDSACVEWTCSRGAPCYERFFLFPRWLLTRLVPRYNKIWRART